MGSLGNQKMIAHSAHVFGQYGRLTAGALAHGQAPVFAGICGDLGIIVICFNILENNSIYGIAQAGRSRSAARAVEPLRFKNAAKTAHDPKKRRFLARYQLVRHGQSIAHKTAHIGKNTGERKKASEAQRII